MISCLIINVISFLFLLKLIFYFLQKRVDNILLWFCFVSIYFVNLPLLVDSFVSISPFTNTWSVLLLLHNKFWEYQFLENQLFNISLFVLIFNIVFVGAYLLVSPIKKCQNTLIIQHSISKNSFLPWSQYGIMGGVGLTFFMLYYGISSFTNLGIEEWYSNREFNSGFIVIAFNFCIIATTSVVLKALYLKRTILGIIFLSPVLAVCYITGARAYMITIVFCLLYYLLSKNISRIYRLFFIIIIIGIMFSILFTLIRGNAMLFYPISRDISYSDLFYSFSNQENITTNGTNTLRLTLTGLPFVDYNTKDISILLADYKFFPGWGSLHPTLYGWAYIDLGFYGFILAIYLGIFSGILDQVRYKLPVKYNILFIPFIMRFITVLIRGSVQNAYSNIVYILFIFIIIYVMLKYVNQSLWREKYNN